MLITNSTSNPFLLSSDPEATISDIELPAMGTVEVPDDVWRALKERESVKKGESKYKRPGFIESRLARKAITEAPSVSVENKVAPATKSVAKGKKPVAGEDF